MNRLSVLLNTITIINCFSPNIEFKHFLHGCLGRIKISILSIGIGGLSICAVESEKDVGLLQIVL